MVCWVERVRVGLGMLRENDDMGDKIGTERDEEA